MIRGRRDRPEVTLREVGQRVICPRRVGRREGPATRNQRVELAVLPDRWCAVLNATRRLIDRRFGVVDIERLRRPRRILHLPVDGKYGQLGVGAAAGDVNTDLAVAGACLAVEAQMATATAATCAVGLDDLVPVVVVKEVVGDWRDGRTVSLPLRHASATAGVASGG